MLLILQSEIEIETKQLREKIKMLLFILPFFSGVLSDDWSVTYNPDICAVRGSNVTIHCSYTYPKNKQLIIEQVLWCSMTTNNDRCVDGPYVYNSAATNNSTNFQYTGDKISNCSLLISNINLKQSEEYKFRFITNLLSERWTGHPGVNIAVRELKVSMTRLRENGTIKAGDSLNLTCTVSCSNSKYEIQWFKNNEPIPQSDPILIFSNVTPKDSGSYSCSLKHFKDTQSEEFTLNVEAHVFGSLGFLITGVFLVLLILIIVAVIFIRRKAKTQTEPKEEAERTKTDRVGHTDHKNGQTSENKLQDEEVHYASVNIKPKGTTQASVNTEMQNEDLTIYSAVVHG